MSRYFRNFFSKLHLKPIYTLPITTLAATTFTTGHEYEINPNKLEKTFEKQQKTTSNNFEDIAFNEMESNFKKTQKKLSNILKTTSNISFSINNELNSKPLPLDSNITSNWDDFYNNIDLIFTNDNYDNIYDNARARMERIVRATQEQFCYEMEKIDGSKFEYNLWKRPQSKTGNGSKYSGGLTKVLQDSKVFEKAGVSVSVSSGLLPPSAVKQMSANHDELNALIEEANLSNNGSVEYFAGSVSSVVHPKNPHAPTGHFNYRYFEIGLTKNGKFIPKVWWFGGGGDLSPSILYEDDCKYFHSQFKNICDKYNNNIYPKYKKWCDKYFIIKHRNNESRGIGGIFFDDVNINSDEFQYLNKFDINEKDKKEYIFQFISELASNWTKAYVPLVKRHAFQEYSDEEKEWQLIRRGRYVEFNLVYDRGTKFGLMKPGARIESILMSLPINANWYYMRQPKYDFEKKIQEIYQNPVDWV